MSADVMVVAELKRVRTEVGIFGQAFPEAVCQLFCPAYLAVRRIKR